MNFRESTACTQPTATLDNSLGLKPYQFGIRVAAVYPGFNSGWSDWSKTLVGPGGSGTVSTISVENTPYGDPTRTTVEYVFFRDDVPPGPGTGLLVADTFTCAG